MTGTGRRTNRCNLIRHATAALVLADTALALVNPNLQPGDLFDRHQTVLALKIISLDQDKLSAELAVEQIFKGEFSPKTVTLKARGDAMMEAFFTVLAKDRAVTAFIGKTRKPLEFTLYAGAEGRWQGGELAAADQPATWNWTKDYKDHELFGTYNGHPGRLTEMMADKSAGRLYFPTTIFDRFKPDQLIGTSAQAVHGVALYDFDGDGLLDIFACSAAGDRLYRQTSPLTFTNRTVELGLAASASNSVSVADANADGRPDILLDSAIWQQGRDGKYSRTDWLPAMPGRDLVHSAFTDVNGDGYPDVLLSRRTGGLLLYLNPGPKGGAFHDATHAAGLDRPECGAGGTGWAMTGDWNHDGHTAIFYSSGSGLLLVRDGKGVFAPVLGVSGYDFKVNESQTALTGAGCFAPVWQSNRPDLLFTRDGGLGMIINDPAGTTLDGVTYGNEVQTSTLSQLPLIAEDLNADGTVDIYLGSRTGKPNMYYLNRNYGSFMVPDRYNPAVFPAGSAHRSGAWGLAAGDVNGDGANDLLIGGVDGRLSLLVNDTLRSREPKENATAMEKIRERIAILSVHVTGRIGVLGASLVLTDSHGRVVGRRDLGSNISCGNRGPDTVNLAVREPGKHSLSVRYSDGHVRNLQLDLKAGKRLVVTADRDGR
jgi:hypothetical protein